jgi:membrane-associated HD superfamily phosphohydrolase
MNEPIKKQPVDELFARKLAGLSMPPDERGFARLQTRMTKQKQPEKVVFWRTPTFQRSVAAAACILLVATLGWYTQSTNQDKLATVNTQNTVARHSPPVSLGEQRKEETSEAVAQQTVPDAELVKPRSEPQQEVGVPVITQERHVEAIAMTKPKINKTQAGLAKEKSVLASEVIEPKSKEQVASVASTPVKDNITPMPMASAPRTLVVTIAEPDVLVAAKQTAQEADQKVVAVNNNTNETGAGKLWRKIQKIRTGEAAVANAAVADDDEKGLLDRAYSEIKHSFQKNKPARQ